MVLRVDVVSAALDAVYGGVPDHRVVALTPQGRQLDQAVVEELPERSASHSCRRASKDSTSASSSTSARMRSPSVRTSSRAASCRRWSSSTPLPACSRARSAARVRANRELLRRPGRRLGVSALHASSRVPRLARPDILVSGDHARIDEWRRDESRAPEHVCERVQRRAPQISSRCGGRTKTRCSKALCPTAGRLGNRNRPRVRRIVSNGRGSSTHGRSRNRVVRATAGLPRWLRVGVDWVVTIVGAIAIVLAIKAFVVNPYRIPSASMEPTLHCARPGSGCESRFSDRVLANRFIYHFKSPARGDIIVFKTPPAAAEKCGAGGTFVKRLIALPGETWEERNGVVYIDGKRLIEPYVKAARRDFQHVPPRTIPPGKYFFMEDNRGQSCDSREWGSVRARTSSARCSSSTGRRLASASARLSSCSASCWCCR